MGCRRECGSVRNVPGAQFTVDGCSALPLFELHGTESVAEPFVEVVEDAGRLGQL